MVEIIEQFTVNILISGPADYCLPADHNSFCPWVGVSLSPRTRCGTFNVMAEAFHYWGIQVCIFHRVLLKSLGITVLYHGWWNCSQFSINLFHPAFLYCRSGICLEQAQSWWSRLFSLYWCSVPALFPILVFWKIDYHLLNTVPGHDFSRCSPVSLFGLSSRATFLDKRASRESARVDGGNDWRILVHIVLPLSCDPRNNRIILWGCPLEWAVCRHFPYRTESLATVLCVRLYSTRICPACQ